ncbi:MAG: hypothetical protein IKC13_01405 [Elusimicrobiaceae bacterium]|nr:hypothetical protein [Elusimicrobiaceae bacterium]
MFIKFLTYSGSFMFTYEENFLGKVFLALLSKTFEKGGLGFNCLYTSTPKAHLRLARRTEIKVFAKLFSKSLRGTGGAPKAAFSFCFFFFCAYGIKRKRYMSVAHTFINALFFRFFMFISCCAARTE